MLNWPLLRQDDLDDKLSGALLAASGVAHCRPGPVAHRPACGSRQPSATRSLNVGASPVLVGEATRTKAKLKFNEAPKAADTVAAMGGSNTWRGRGDNLGMQVFRGLRHPGIAPACALTIGNFDGVHRGHQAMLALLTNEARHRGVPSCVLSFEPHPRDYFAARAGTPEAAPRRVALLRDKLSELERCGIDQAVIMRFDARFAGQSPQAFIDDVLVRGLRARYVLVGDDFRFGAKRAGDYAMLDAAGARAGFDVARMMSYEVHGLRVSSSSVRDALARGDMGLAATLLGRPYSISGHVLHGRKLGRELGTPTLNLRFGHERPAATGVFVVRVHGLADHALDGVASLGVRPTVEAAGRQLLEVHCLQWPAELGTQGGYGRCVRVDLLHKLHDERKYASLDALRDGIAQDVADAQAWLAAEGGR